MSSDESDSSLGDDISDMTSDGSTGTETATSRTDGHSDTDASSGDKRLDKKESDTFMKLCKPIDEEEESKAPADAEPTAVMVDISNPAFKTKSQNPDDPIPGIDDFGRGGESVYNAAWFAEVSSKEGFSLARPASATAGRRRRKCFGAF